MNWLERRIRIGRFASIDLYLHWSLLLIIGYVVSTTYRGGPSVVANSLGHLVGMFLCVTLHEYGHAMAARYYGIRTADITLLAIGGIARLRRMPRIPIRELVVAVAGPAVNVVIIAVILLGLQIVAPDWNRRLFDVVGLAVATPGSDAAAAGTAAMVTLSENVAEPTPIGFVLVMLTVNAVLVLFNFIPAFPMDGGRVLRSILAMMMDYRRATYVASRIGWAAAAMMAFAAVSGPAIAYVPLAISAFIIFAGDAEYQSVAVTERVRGIRVADVTVPVQRGVSMDAPVQTVANHFRGTIATTLPVVGVDNLVTGVVTIDQVARRIDQFGIDDSQPLGMWVDHDRDCEPVHPDDWLEDIVPGLPRTIAALPVVDHRGGLIGMVDLANIPVRSKLSAPETTSFNQTV